jgi:hypothetical protein
MESAEFPDLAEDNEGKFNMGIRTLIRIDEILTQITRIYLMPGLDRGAAQHIKAIMVKQLQIRAAPLMPEEENKKIKVRIDDIKLRYYTQHDQYTGEVSSVFEHFDITIEKLLDDLVEDVELTLQKEGCYFMPNKSEQALF